jgi:hypothetical protein
MRARIWVAAAAALIALAFTAPSAASAGTLDQSQTSTSGGAGIFGGSDQYAQTFTAGLSGGLDQVDVPLSKDCQRNGVTVEIRTVSADGKPTNATLASAVIPDASVTSAMQFLSVPFASPAPVTTGTQYAIVLSSPTSTMCPPPMFLDPSHTYEWGFAAGNPYPGGQGWGSQNGGMSWGAFGDFEFGFKTYVVEGPPPPPEPVAPPEPVDSAPETTITKGPKDKTKKKTATFEFTGADARVIVGFECNLDNNLGFSPCTSPTNVKVGRGKHTFSVRATDQAGNVGAPATDTWKVKKKRKR